MNLVIWFEAGSTLQLNHIIHIARLSDIGKLQMKTLGNSLILASLD